MNKKTSAFVNSLVLISLALGSASVEAKRLGGGTSFGSKPSYSAPYSRAALPPSNRVATPPPVSHPAPVAQPANSNQAWKDRAIGAAAGLAVGGLVGSMMGGHENAPAPQQNSEAANNQGYAQQQQQYVQPAQPVQPQQGYAQPAPQTYAPAPMQQQQGYAPAPVQQNQGYAQPYTDNTGATKSGGIGFLGYLLLGGLGYLAYRFFFAKKNPTTPASQPNYQRTSNEPAYSAPAASSGSSADFNTDIMFKKGDSTVSSSKVNLAKSRDTAMPAGFDSVAFLDDVKRRYMDLQQAWDARDFAEIRGLTTDKVFAEIQDQLKSSNDVNETDVLKLDADILEVRELSSEFEAVVLFDAIMREDEAGQANQVREVWHFVKSKSGFNANWMLDGIQQLED
ncbi:MAG: TIM44-like domain-containing protein [Methylococcales bacterium]|nr:TIM44-like domain-containing protein [Methylococcales bacterium]MDD5753790.1 TIM44-like domain-containing protein [Methylococcales bacterium]